MFDLEQAIADWRRQMLAAGIKTPVPLEELKSHPVAGDSRPASPNPRSICERPSAVHLAVRVCLCYFAAG